MAYLGEEIRKLGFGLMRLPGASSAESVSRYVRSISGSGKSWTERLRLWNKTEYQVHGRLPLADMSVSSGMMWDMTSS